VGSRSRARARAQVNFAPAEETPRPAPEPEPRPARPVPPRHGLLTGAALVQAIQAAGILAASVLCGVDTVNGQSYHVNSGIALTVIGILTAAGLGYVALGLARARYWSRTPALITQLLTGLVSIYLILGDKYGWGVSGLVLALAGFALIAAPPSIRVLNSQTSR
jgi:hypothetical protein